MTSKISLNYLALIFIIPFSGFYITKLPLSPIYFFAITGFFFVILYLFIRHRITNTFLLQITSFMFVFFSSFQILFFEPNISTYINMIFSLMVFLFTLMIIQNVQSSILISLSEKMIYFSVILLCYEAYYRITHPVFFVNFAKEGREDLEFYYYKINSIMYQDSNFVGLFIISLFFFLLYIKEYTYKKYYLLFILLFILTLATISRASILALILVGILYLFKEKIYYYRFYFLGIGVFLILILLPILMEYRNIDDSFSSKFHIIETASKYIQTANVFSLLFGVGLGNTVQVLNIGAHNIIVLYLVETGLIGLLLTIYLWGYILHKTKYKAGIVMFPFLLNGMSLATVAVPYLYVMYAVIIQLEERKNNNAR